MAIFKDFTLDNAALFDGPGLAVWPQVTGVIDKTGLWAFRRSTPTVSKFKWFHHLLPTTSHKVILPITIIVTAQSTYFTLQGKEC